MSSSFRDIRLVRTTYWMTQVFKVKSPEKNYDKLGKRIGLNKQNICKSQIGRDQVSGGVSVPCQHATPVVNVLWKPVISRKKVEFDKMVTDWYKV